VSRSDTEIRRGVRPSAARIAATVHIVNFRSSEYDPAHMNECSLISGGSELDPEIGTRGLNGDVPDPSRLA